MTNPTKISQTGIGLLTLFEGLRLEAYKDIAGVWTIGYGSTAGVKPTTRLRDKAEAEALLKRDLGLCERAVSKAVTAKMKQNQFDAMVSLCYNIGIGAFKRSSVLRKLNDGDDYGAAEAFLLWCKATVGGKRVVVPGLLRRRKAERELFLR